MAAGVLSEPGRWRAGWLILGVLAAGCGLLAGRVAGRVPAPAAVSASGPARCGPLAWALVSFALFGLGYVPYTTFAVTYWRQGGATTGTVTALWAVLATAATASAWIWRRSLTRPSAALVVLLAGVTLAAALPLVPTAVPTLTVSAALFGGGFLTVSAAVTALIGQRRPEDEQSKNLAGFNAVFGAGQVAGPALTGQLADHVGLRGGLTAACGLLVLATLAAVFQANPWRQPHNRQSRSGEEPYRPRDHTTPTGTTS